MKEYAVYQGESVISIGTLEHCANDLGIDVRTMLSYLDEGTVERDAAYKAAHKSRRRAVALDDVAEKEPTFQEECSFKSLPSIPQLW